MITLEQEILGALARGYTTDENSSKDVDVVLVEAMCIEVMKLFYKELPETVILDFENFPKNKATVEDLLDTLLNIKKRR